MTDKIEIETLIEASNSTVWEVVTKPEHIAHWFGCIAEFELKPGAKGKLIWKDHGEASLTIVEVDVPNLFSSSLIFEFLSKRRTEPSKK